ncbi:hypothetical protein [Chitinophaga sancti]|uniref:Uncharacterized protein n=1 Tax=Chitinophaga sancti TaxID=1004 RepID=A0A1K1NSS7_9BACT|nr:hypothetical protein [Chitinophaga sancti]WQD60102.1 hypothetical protein U0033_19630 [Chitinophaga sancti]WQG87770.1 hypothetical protein SR876_22840 [Chitinophaga sancti]SFW37478.1 hypothetical protein SAMN05661012_01394 [Chitinophaga sancti]
MKLNLYRQYAASFASLGVIAVITTFTISVSVEQHQLNNQQDAPDMSVAVANADTSSGMGTLSYQGAAYKGANKAIVISH